MASLCPACGRLLLASAASCPYCGAGITPAAAEKAAVAIELTGWDRLPRVDAASVRELAANFWAAVESLAARFNGTIEREDAASAVVIFGHRGITQAGLAAVHYAQALSEAAAEVLAAAPPGVRGYAALRTGVDAVADEADPPEAGIAPRVSARRLRRKAAAGTILAGTNVVRLAASEFTFEGVGFYQTRSVAPVKIYRLTGLVKRTSAPAFRLNAGFKIPRPQLETAFDRFFEAVVDRRGPYVLYITGDAGAGKTTAAKTAARRARARDMSVLTTTCYERRQYQPFAGWAELWRQLFRLLGPYDAAIGIPAALASLEAAYEIWAPLFADAAGYDFPSNAFVTDAPPALRRAKLIEITRALLERAAALRPLALVCDDLHLADPSSRELWDALTVPAKAPIALIGTTRDQMPATDGRIVIAPPPFTLDEIWEALGKGGPAAAAKFFTTAWERTRGHPALTIQLFRAEEEGHSLSLTSLAALPSSPLTTFVANRLKDRSRGWRQALAVTALLGLPFGRRDAAALAGVLKHGDAGLLAQWVREWLAGGWLTKPLGGDNKPWRVPPHLTAVLPDVLLARPDERRDAYRAAGELIGHRYPAEWSAALSIGLEAGAPGAASDAHTRARDATAWAASAEAAALLTAALNAPASALAGRAAPANVRGQLFLARAKSYAAFDTASANADLTAAEKAAPDVVAQAELLRGDLLRRDGKFAEAEKALAQATGAAGAVDPLTAAQAQLAQARLRLDRGDVDGARAYLPGAAAFKYEEPDLAVTAAELDFRAGSINETTFDVAYRLADVLTERKPYAAATLKVALAPLAFHRGRRAVTHRLLEQAGATAEALGDHGLAARVLTTAAALNAGILSLDESDDEWRKAAAVSRGAGRVEETARAWLGLAQNAVFRGDGPAAAAYLKDYEDAAAGGPPESVAARQLVTSLYHYFIGGEPGPAHAAAQTAMTAFLSVGDVPESGWASAAAAWFATAAGFPDRAVVILNHPELKLWARSSRPYFVIHVLAEAETALAQADDTRGGRLFRAATAAAREMGMWLVEGICLLRLAAGATETARREEYRRRARWLLDTGGARLNLPTFK